MKQIILIAFITAAAIKEAYCPKYICNSTKAAYNGTCFNFNGTDFFGAKCQQNQRCPNIVSTNFSKCKDKGYDQILKLPGQKALQPSDCKSQKMEKTYCIGSSIGMTCAELTECDVGLICTAGTNGQKICREAKKNGEKCNHFADICASGLYCDNTDFVCEYYGSTKVGSQVGSQFQDTECESFYLDIFDGYTCVLPPKRLSSDYVGLGEKCYFTYTSSNNITINFTDESHCGMNSQGKPWCDPDYSALENQRNILKKFLINDNKIAPCSIFEPFPFCEHARVEMAGFMDAIRAYFELKIHDFDELYKTILDVDECFHDSNPLYYYGGSSVVSVGLMLALLIILG